MLKNFISKAIAFFPADLKDWHLKSKTDFYRLSVFIVLLCLVFGSAAYLFYFQANDAFVYFRYVSNALKGYGYVWNSEPFAHADGYTGILWVLLLQAFATIGISIPVAANILSFLFSLGSVGMCFAFLRRMPLPDLDRRKSFCIFLIVCFILITNTTFDAFMSSGTEAALFNFLVLWWCFEASAADRNPVWMTVCASLIAVTRTEGIVFIPACLPFLILLQTERKNRKNAAYTLLAFLPFAAFARFLFWRKSFYGSYIPNAFLASFEETFPPFAWDYLLSFAVEYGLYFWVPVFALWTLMFCLFKRFKMFIIPVLLALPFVAYVAWLVFLTGADTLEYRLLGFFIPLCLLAGIRMITQNISATFRFLCICLGLYWICASPIPWTHYFLTRDLNTRAQTAFLYQPVSKTFEWLFSDFWDEAQKRLISQGIALRRQEHKVLTEELLKSFPSRKDGEKIKKEHSRLFAWSFAGVPAWVFPEAYIIDLSGQNDPVIARMPVRNLANRKMGHDRVVSPGYLICFNGGANIKVTPFDGKPDVAYLASAPLNEAVIRGCEAFWRSMVKEKIDYPVRLKNPDEQKRISK